MKGYELIKAITENKIKDNTTIKVKMGNTYKATLKYENLMLKWQSGDFDTSILCSTEADFEVIEENKEIEELNDTNYNCEEMSIEETNCYNNLIRTKLNEVIRAVNKINKQLEELEPPSEISEEEINDAIKRAREYIEREEK